MNKTISTTQPATAPLWVLVVYALGQMGWSLALFAPQNLLTYFYLPPETSDLAAFPPYIFQGAVFGFLTVIGMLAAFGRLFDAVTDPLIANWSDRSTAKMGRRRKYMMLSFIPFAALSFLMYYPPFEFQSTWNVVWLGSMTLLYYFFFTLYVTPYTALISELGHDSKQRLLISTLVSVTFALGAAVGFSTFGLQAWLETSWGYSSVEAFQSIVGCFAILSGVLMALPIIFVDENKYCAKIVSEESPLEAVKSVFANYNFRWFAYSDLIYWVALTFIQTGIIYYVTILLGLDKGLTSWFAPIILVLSFLVYWPINIAAQKYGQIQLLLWGFLGFALVFGLIFFLGWLPVSPYLQGALLVLLTILPLATFSILPNAVVADMADEDGRRTGNFKAGMFFAVRAFMMKIGLAIGNIAFTSTLLLGRSVEQDLGVRMTGLVAMVLCLVAYFLLRKVER